MVILIFKLDRALGAFLIAADCAAIVVTTCAIPEEGYRVYRMTEGMQERQKLARELAKTPTGIKGLDEILLGGLPQGRPTLVCGSAGCGKTLLGMEFLVRGAQLGEPGVCMTFEERVEDMIDNVASLGFDLPMLMAEKKLRLDHVQLDRSQIEE